MLILKCMLLLAGGVSAVSAATMAFGTSVQIGVGFFSGDMFGFQNLEMGGDAIRASSGFVSVSDGYVSGETGLSDARVRIQGKTPSLPTNGDPNQFATADAFALWGEGILIYNPTQAGVIIPWLVEAQAFSSTQTQVGLNYLIFRDIDTPDFDQPDIPISGSFRQSGGVLVRPGVTVLGLLLSLNYPYEPVNIPTSSFDGVARMHLYIPDFITAESASGVFPLETATPEPSAMLLSGMGLAGFGCLRRWWR